MPTLKQAKAAANLEKLDSIGSNPKDFIQANKFNALENACAAFIERVHVDINAQPQFVNSGKIADLSIEGSNGHLTINGYPHTIYQDRGTNGVKEKFYDTPHQYSNKRPPVAPFLELIKSRNIQLKDNEKYKADGSPYKEYTEEEQQLSLAWAMSWKVYNYGYKPRNFFGKHIKKLIDDCAENLANVAVQSIDLNIDLINPATKRII